MIRSDEQQDRIDHYTESSSLPTKFTLNCHVTDVVDLDYIVPVEFCEDIIEGTFEGRILVDLHIQADHLVEDIRNSFDMFVNRMSYKLLRVYDRLNQEIK